MKTLRTTLGIIVLKLILGFSGCNAISKDDMLNMETGAAGFYQKQHLGVARDSDYVSSYREYIHAGRYSTKIDGVYFKSPVFVKRAVQETQMPYSMQTKTKTSE